jgi:hypothetical protein
LGELNFNAVKKHLLILILLFAAGGSFAQVKMYKKGEVYQMGDFHYVAGKWMNLYQIKNNRVVTNAYVHPSCDSIVVLDTVNYKRILDAGADVNLFVIRPIYSSNEEMRLRAQAIPDLTQRVIKLEMDAQLEHLEMAGMLIEKGANQVRYGFMTAILGPLIGSMLLVYGPTSEAQLAGALISGASGIIGLGLIIGGTGNLSQGGKMLRPSTPVYQR